MTGTFCDDIKYFWGLFFWLGSKACRQNVPTTGLEFSSLWFFARLELLPAMLHSIKPKKQLGYVGGLNPSSSSFFDEESPRTNRSLTWKDSFSYLAPFISFYSRKNEGKTTSKRSQYFCPTLIISLRNWLDFPLEEGQNRPWKWVVNLWRHNWILLAKNWVGECAFKAYFGLQ